MLNFIPLPLRTQALMNIDFKSLGKIVKSYAQTKKLNSVKELHAQLLRLRYPLCTSITNHLIIAYFKCGVFRYAHNLFDKMPKRNIFSWTSMITALSQDLRLSEALKTFSLMRISGLSPTQFAFASLIRACVSLRSVGVGKQVHCLALKTGLGWEMYVVTNLSDMYSRSGKIVDACKLFEEMQCKNVVLWTAMIDGYAKNGEFDSALLAFKMMNGEEICIDPHILTSTISACASMRALEFGRSLHSIVVKLGFELEHVVGITLIDMYSRSGDMESSLNVFLILLDCGKIEFDPYVLPKMLSACASMRAHKLGKCLHSIAVKLGCELELVVGNSLIDIYSSLGDMESSSNVFQMLLDCGRIELIPKF